jgi:hypothetical protein
MSPWKPRPRGQGLVHVHRTLSLKIRLLFDEKRRFIEGFFIWFVFVEREADQKAFLEGAWRVSFGLSVFKPKQNKANTLTAPVGLL